MYPAFHPLASEQNLHSPQTHPCFSLKGITYAPELVPRYLQRLLEEAVFAEASFSLMELNRSAENTEEILFTVGTDIGEG
jgi:hypothetical protein